jgi:hypothetical protein
VKNGVANRQPSITGEIALQAVSDLFGTLLYLHKLQVNSLAFGVGMALWPVAYPSHANLVKPNCRG